MRRLRDVAHHLRDTYKTIVVCAPVTRVVSPWIEEATPNQGSTCVKGRFGTDFVLHRDRLTTPLIRSIKRAWPDCEIDVLAYAATGGILSGNPDIARVIGIPEPPNVLQDIALMARLWKRYALAVSTQPGDRPTRYALIAGRKSAAPVQDRLTGRIANAMLTRSVPLSGSVHRVEEVLKLADALGIARVPEIIGPAITRSDTGERYAVIHAKPMYRYKQWTAEGWRTLAAALAQRGFTIKATGGPDPAERAYLDEVWAGSPAVERLDGKRMPRQ